MDLRSCLAWLSDADLEAVLTNRPEAAVLRSRARSNLSLLASHLGQAYAIERAARGLDRFHLQLLQLGCVLGGLLDNGTAGEQGVPLDALETATWELARHGLAFPDPDADGLVVPREVLAAISYRHSLGRSSKPRLARSSRASRGRSAHQPAARRSSWRRSSAG
jgi:hypothetical protein